MTTATKTLNIKDPAVYAAAHKLAELQGTSMTAAVRSAVEGALEHELAKSIDRKAAIEKIQAMASTMTFAHKSDKDLYSDNGLPIW